MASTNIVDQLVFYGSYHNNKWNQLIHVVCVPAIFFSLCIGLCYTGPLLNNSDSVLFRYMNGAAVCYAVFAVLYFCLDIIGAAVANSALLACLIAANFCYDSFGPGLAWKYALAVHILSWALQIVGHVYIEKRNPAFMDSFFQSLFLAPLFVCTEMVFLCGFRPKLRRDVEKRVKANVLVYRRSQLNKQ
uniref:DUF962 domain-containing protein n=1 Tax=Spongospora subterranea TaxID=70186 RepID=A0A0H5R5Q9_9EUKA|eukprot:CRZ09490.1 hypothetical protein [Spongospora subterranea]